MNLLEELHNGKITVDQAQTIHDEGLSSDPPRSSQSLGFSEFEMTAYAHGATIEDLVDWRYNGWPAVCCRCKKPIVVQEYGWTVCEHGEKTLMEHLVCPKPKRV